MCPVHRNDGEISAIGRAAAVLKEFRGSGRSLGVSALARRTGLPKATVHRLLVELTRVRLLDRVGTGYRPGLLLFELGQSTPPSRNLHTVARPHMDALHEATGHNVGLAVLQDRDVVYVDILRGRSAPRLPQLTGGRWPAHASCSGKAMLAHVTSELLQQFLAEPLPALTPQTITDPGQLRRELERARRSGSAYDRRESFPTVAGTASPLLAADGTVVGALSVSGLAGRINLSRLDAAVRTTALTISRDLAEAELIVRPVLRHV
ncbi:IclR family transcriptional regulator [Streptomyces albus]|uniref:IclR family transcriptional regulator n=1 Tax=Streptomyces albus (strain ATCC 21838 / DSM 41398 / FERM P-419 / JCM 4703 / NBRC 107858) TaxID=1081613 RepID=A0A0B5ENZ5_STRA4|nr:IclR family transcriptional regulator [Streptomyces albus]AOU74848.1 IclR family transcriptional regulator [Streptomyces albus]AYN30657.1 IclR family transcriptional regulator [Streptomyces albus]